MFECLLNELIGGTQGIQVREDGVAFLRVAKSLHPLTAITYVGFNISLRSTPGRHLQCTYSDRWAKQCVSVQPIGGEHLSFLAPALREPLNWSDLPEAEREPLCQRAGLAGAELQVLSFPVRPVAGEVALFCVGAEMPPDDWKVQKGPLSQELRILAAYFHNHILRIHGHDTDSAILVSARELDCLKWIAAGKTAWEASVILGISERTVRFHLNAAREKLDCLTTTQAVAKAVSQQLI